VKGSGPALSLVRPLKPLILPLKLMPATSRVARHC
jgi:hypothetical protein